MARYLVLIYGDEAKWEQETAQTQEEKGRAHGAFMAKAGQGLLAGGELELSATATSLRAGAAGHPTATDGPFLETKEALGGFYLVEATDLDEVIALAEQLQEVHTDYSGVEIRPLVRRN